MEMFFGTPWSDVTLDTVEAFFAQAGGEGLTWEAKGTKQPHPHSVRKHVGAFGNTVGGFYIVGATQDGATWKLDPVSFSDEPQTWLSKVIRANLRPIPFFDVKSWKSGTGHVAVVNADPVAEPPCMTNDGEVFMRVSGESYPVTDPFTLQRLLERGTSRRADIEAIALRAAILPDEERDDVPGESRLRLRLAVAPTGRADDISARLFTEAFYKELMTGIEGLPSEPLFFYGKKQNFGRMTTQDSILLQEKTPDNRQRWTLRARWDGSVAAYLDLAPKLEDNPELGDTAIFGDAIRPAAHGLVNLVQRLGGYGRAHLVLVVDAHSFRVRSINGNVGEIPAPDKMLPIRTWIELPLPADDLDDALDRMRRELCRASGAIVWES